MSQREAWDRWHTRGEVESTSPEGLFALHRVRPRKGSNFLDVGVGVGDMARAALGLGAIVDAVDISPVAGEQVKGIVRRFYLADDIADLPSNEYRLALSHLVAQHTEDADFAFQTGQIYRALRAGGVYSIQFAGSDKGLASRVTPSMAEVGHVVRAPGEAISLCEAVCPGAEVGLVSEPERWPAPKDGTYYYYIHVKKPKASVTRRAE